MIEKYWDKIACAFAPQRRRPHDLEGRESPIRWHAGQRKDFLQREGDGYGKLRTCLCSARRQFGGASGGGECRSSERWRPPLHLQKITRRFFEQLAPVEDEDTAKWIRALDTSERADLAARRLAEMNPVWNAMLRDTITPTELNAGVRANVIPAQASANLNIRLLPGNSIQDTILQMQKAVNDPQVKFTVQPDGGQNAPASSITSEFYQTIERVAMQQFPAAAVVPYLSTGATDSAYLRLHNVQAYGLLPFPLTEADILRMHADDERIPITSFSQAWICSTSGAWFRHQIIGPRKFAAPKLFALSVPPAIPRDDRAFDARGNGRRAPEFFPWHA